MASRTALPRKVHFEVLCRTFGCLKNHNDELVINPYGPLVDLIVLERKYWRSSILGLVLNEKGDFTLVCIDLEVYVL